jgi:hypothetical protein
MRLKLLDRAGGFIRRAEDSPSMMKKELLELSLAGVKKEIDNRLRFYTRVSSKNWKFRIGLLKKLCKLRKIRDDLNRLIKAA